PDGTEVGTKHGAKVDKPAPPDRCPSKAPAGYSCILIPSTSPTHMPGTDILCTTDLTPVSDTALRYAVLVAQRTESRITQLHVLPRNERTPETRTAVEAAMAEQRMRCGAQELATPLLVEDDVLKGVAQETTRGHRLLISGTHGPRGLR